ncbi:hypothetical protein CLOP_g20665 [Closterium sp. NIES-67]|nr:hypothetical protein CLOP_g20665 [Closterium sp. NIES-67]
MKSLSLAGSVVIHTIQGYKDWLPLVGTDGVAIEDLGRECGAVVSMGCARRLCSETRTDSCTRIRPHVRTWGAACTGTPTTPPLTARATARSSTTMAAASTAPPRPTSPRWTPARLGEACSVKACVQGVGRTAVELGAKVEEEGFNTAGICPARHALNTASSCCWFCRGGVESASI